MGELVPGECMINALHINDGRSLAWAPDLRCVWDALQGLLEERGMPTVEENEEEERRPSMAGEGVLV